jgi:hypothetical protein
VTSRENGLPGHLDPAVRIAGRKGRRELVVVVVVVVVVAPAGLNALAIFAAALLAARRAAQPAPAPELSSPTGIPV